MDNFTHSLAGAALAEAALRDRSAPASRRLFLAGGVIASNVPDIDLLYTAITPPPLGYLLHHRGHTHTVAGVAMQGVLLATLFLLLPALRRLAPADRRRFFVLVAAGVLGHLGMDAWNSYGVHPFHPVDPGWYYGDAVFIFEPWLWVLLGAAAAANAATRVARVALAVLVVLLPLGLVHLGIVPGRALVLLGAGLLAFAWGTRRLPPRARAAVALAASALLASTLFALGRVARAEVAGRLGKETGGRILDLVLTPNPASLSCWEVIAIERREAEGDYVLRRGTLSLWPAWQPATGCASYRFAAGRESGPDLRAMAWSERIRAPLAELRELSARDCWVRAWLQFGRAPYVEAGVIRDLRFERGGGNFTAMGVAPPGQSRGCPPYMTSWAVPRADLLARPAPRRARARRPSPRRGRRRARLRGRCGSPPPSGRRSGSAG